MLSQVLCNTIIIVCRNTCRYVMYIVMRYIMLVIHILYITIILYVSYMYLLVTYIIMCKNCLYNNYNLKYKLIIYVYTCIAFTLFYTVIVCYDTSYIT